MYRSIWDTFHKSVCILNFFNKKGILFFRSTGFRYNNYLISSPCSTAIKNAGHVVIEFNSSGEKLSLTHKKFDERFSEHKIIGLAGIIMIRLNADEFGSVPSVPEITYVKPVIGTQVAMLACSRKFNQLYLKSGMISSSFTDNNGVKLMLIESSFEQGNCGAPLIDALTGKLIGVMVDFLPSPSESHKKLKHIINENIRLLSEVTGKWTIGDIDPAQVLTANQHMIKFLARDTYLTSHLSSGFAIPVSRISSYIRNLVHETYDKP